jgi:hypothetical protein
MPYGKRSTWNEVRELDGSSIWWMYEEVGAPLEKAARVVVFTNNTDIDIWFSTIPSTKIDNIDMLKLAPYSSSTWDITTQRALDDKPLLIPIGTQFYARRFWEDSPADGTWVSVACLIVESGS